MGSVEQQADPDAEAADPVPSVASLDPDEDTGAATMMDRDLASASAGVQVTAIGDGTAEATMTVRDDMANGHGITHGGFVFLLADTAFACACNDSRAVTVAAGADITFLSATRPGDVLIARAARRSERGRSGIYDVTVTRLEFAVESEGAADPAGVADPVAAPAETVVAEFRGRSRTLPPR